MSVIFFSDFDGTITERDVIESIMSNFAPSEWKNIHNSLMRGDLDIDVGIRMMFNLIPAEKEDEIKKWVKSNIRIREGFGELLNFLEDRGIPFVILSGGVDFYIYPIIEKYLSKIKKIYSNRLFINEGKLDVKFNYRCGKRCRRNCGICKPYIIQNHYKSYKIKMYAGDGITDLDACQDNDIIFSTGGLAGLLGQINLRGKRVYQFSTFNEVIKVIREYGEGILL